MSWSRGSDQIQSLIDRRELDRVEPNVALARRLVVDADHHLASARTIGAGGDLTGAYQLAYDALRKSAVALLAAQGLRATSRGGHVAVQEAVVAQFGDGVGAFRAFGRVRRNRNRFEYPGDMASEPTSDDLDDALRVASEAAEKAATILDRGILSAWSAR